MSTIKWKSYRKIPGKIPFSAWMAVWSPEDIEVPLKDARMRIMLGRVIKIKVDKEYPENYIYTIEYKKADVPKGYKKLPEPHIFCVFRGSRG